MEGVKVFRKISKDVTAAQITREIFSEKVPDEFKDKIVINPASRQVLLYGKGRETVTGKLTDWIIMDGKGNFSIIPHAEFVKDYEPIESGMKITEPIIGVEPGTGDSTVTGSINTPPGEDINLDTMGSSEGQEDEDMRGVMAEAGAKELAKAHESYLDDALKPAGTGESKVEEEN
jgi:hypothetical protein